MDSSFNVKKYVTLIPAAVGLLLFFTHSVGVYGFVVSGLVTMLLATLLLTSEEQKRNFSFPLIFIGIIMLIAYLLWFIASQGDQFIF